MKETKMAKENVGEFNPFNGEIEFREIAKAKETIMDNGRIRLR